MITREVPCDVIIKSRTMWKAKIYYRIGNELRIIIKLKISNGGCRKVYSARGKKFPPLNLK